MRLLPTLALAPLLAPILAIGVAHAQQVTPVQLPDGARLTDSVYADERP